MKLKEEVLTLLLENEKGLSGEDMAKRLYVSRTAIWKAVKELRKEEYHILSATNRGYRLVPHGDLLSEKLIRNAIGETIQIGKIHNFKVIPSTNTYGKKLLLEGCVESDLVVADSQSAGRGRFGRSFYSPSGTGAYFTFLLTPPLLTQENQGLLTLIAALAVAYAIEELSTEKPTIKWVNDLYIREKKVCGILCEGIGDLESGCFQGVAMGFGINMTTSHFADGLREKATSLFLNHVSRNQMIGRVIAHLHGILEMPAHEVISAYTLRCGVLGKKLDYRVGEKFGIGTAIAITSEGHLLLKQDDNTQLTLKAGEVTFHDSNTPISQ